VPKSYPNSVRRQISHRRRSGDAVADTATGTGISAATLFRWKDQALMMRERGTEYRASSPTSSHRHALASFALETELALTRDACTLFDDQSVVPPEGRTRSSKD
jgi:transposase